MGQDIIHGLGQLGHIDFTVLVFIGTAGVIQRGDAVLFLAIQPGGDNTYAYANNNVLGAIDALGLSSTLTELFQEEALPFSPIGPGSDSSTVDTTASLVTHPTTLTDDITDLGVTDLDQLVDNYFTLGSVCDTDEALAQFALQIKKIIGGDVFPSAFNSGYLLVGEEIDLVITAAWRYELDETDNARTQLRLLSQKDNSSILLIPECSGRDGSPSVEDIVTQSLGTLIHASEIAEIVASMEHKANGCNEASLVDVTDLHAEVLERFQIKLNTDPRVVAAEKALILAQAALEDFLTLHPNNNCDLSLGVAFDFNVCVELNALTDAVETAAEELAEVTSDVYQEQIDAGMMPSHDSEAAEAAVRQQIMLGVLGIFVPLTPEDAAIDAAITATTAGFGKVARVFGNAIDFFTNLGRTVRASRIGDALADGAAAINRSDAIKLDAYLRDYPGLSDLNYADIVRFESKLGADGLQKLEADFVNTPGLAAAFKNNPALVNGWKIVDDAAEAGVVLVRWQYGSSCESWHGINT